MDRKEAIEKVRQMSLPKETMEILEVLAPELRESEDEKIRKFLVDYFTSYKIGNVTTKLNGYRIDDIIAYLEKQKEQKPVDLSEMMVHKEPYIAPVPTPMVADEQKQVEPTGKLSREDYLHQLLIDQLITYSDYEYLTGKKPAEWSEEDEKMIECLIRHTQEEFNDLCNDRYGHQEIISDLKESCRERMSWLENRLKSLRPVSKESLQSHWKPSENEECKNSK